jgi:hypothetical protein
MSISSEVAPTISIAATVATAVWDTVTTVLPGPISSARNARAIASVPLPQPTDAVTPSHAANSASNARSSWPRTYQPDSSARATAPSISARNAR